VRPLRITINTYCDSSMELLVPSSLSDLGFRLKGQRPV